MIQETKAYHIESQQVFKPTSSIERARRGNNHLIGPANAVARIKATTLGPRNAQDTAETNKIWTSSIQRKRPKLISWCCLHPDCHHPHPQRVRAVRITGHVHGVKPGSSN